MSTNLGSANWLGLFRAFIGDEEDAAFNTTSLRWHYAIGSLEAGYTVTDMATPILSETLTLASLDAVTLVAYAARSLLSPKKQLTSFSTGSPRRSFRFDNVHGALQRAQSFICEHDTDFAMPSDYANDIQIILDIENIAIDTETEEL